MPPMLVKLQRKGQMVIPRPLREEAGVVDGTLLKVSVIAGGRFLVTPQVSIDRTVITEGTDDKKALGRLRKVVSELREESKQKGLDKITSKEINRAVTAAKRDLRNTSKTQPK